MSNSKLNDLSFFSALFIIRSNKSVTPPSAETTTTDLSDCFDTISITLLIEILFATEVPPNFKTFIFFYFE